MRGRLSHNDCMGWTVEEWAVHHFRRTCLSLWWRNLSRRKLTALSKGRHSRVWGTCAPSIAEAVIRTPVLAVQTDSGLRRSTLQAELTVPVPGQDGCSRANTQSLKVGESTCQMEPLISKVIFSALDMFIKITSSRPLYDTYSEYNLGLHRLGSAGDRTRDPNEGPRRQDKAEDPLYPAFYPSNDALSLRHQRPGVNSKTRGKWGWFFSLVGLGVLEQGSGQGSSPNTRPATLLVSNKTTGAASQSSSKSNIISFYGRLCFISACPVAHPSCFQASNTSGAPYP